MKLKDAFKSILNEKAEGEDLLDKRQILIDVGLLHPKGEKSMYDAHPKGWKHPKADAAFDMARKYVGDNPSKILRFLDDLTAIMFDD